MATKHPSRGNSSLPAFNVERLEKRQLMASISGTIWNDLNSSKSFEKGEPILPDWTVFLDTNKNRKLDAGETTQVTDAKGNYSFQNLAPGTYYVGEVLKDGFGQTYPGRSGTAGSDFNIDVRFIGGLSPQVQALFRQAAARWEAVIVGDIPSAETDIGTVDDIAIDATGETFDGEGGLLAQAAPTQLRDGSFLPARGMMEFDVADLAVDTPEARQLLLDTITHEMGHALGFGTIWTDKGVLVGRGTGSPQFVGAQAVAEYNAVFRSGGISVPVEGTGGPGTADSHWSEDVFGDELMSPYAADVPAPLSRVTAASMGDLGYVVDLSGADPFTPAFGLRASAVGGHGYRAVANYPVTILPPVVPVAGGVGVTASALTELLPFSHTVTVTTKKSRKGVDFGNRKNTGPTIGVLQIDPGDVVIGTNVALRALNVVDAEKDQIIQVNFYREANGTAGLQTGAGGDLYIGADTNFTKGGWRVDAPTTGLAEGSSTYYARAFDALEGTSTKRASNQQFTPQPKPLRPSDVTVSALSSLSQRVSWTDNSANENGFQIQRSTNPGFTLNLVNYRVGKGVKTLDVAGLTPGTIYYYRVRAFNTGGSSGYSEGSFARTLTTGEVIVDNSFNKSSVALKGTWATDESAKGYFRSDYLQDGNSGKSKSKGKAAVFLLDVPVAGEYFVYGRWTQGGANSAAVPYYVTSSTQDEPQVQAVNQSTRGGGWVLLGTYEFGRGGGENSVTISTQGTTGTVIADAVRLLPTTETVDKLTALYGTGGVSASSVREAIPATSSMLTGVSTMTINRDVLANNRPRSVYAGLRSPAFKEADDESVLN